MAKFYPALTESLNSFIRQQHIFFIATTPESGRINLSPKGMDSLKVLNDKQVAYMDLTGSGNETAAHLKQNGRVTMMFCSFDENPLILRLYGHGRSILPRDPEWRELHPLFKPLPGERQLILLDIESLQSSCGYAVPLYEYQGERDMLARWVEKKGESGIMEYWSAKNRVSIDGLPTGLFPD